METRPATQLIFRRSKSNQLLLAILEECHRCTPSMPFQCCLRKGLKAIEHPCHLDKVSWAAMQPARNPQSDICRFQYFWIPRLSAYLTWFMPALANRSVGSSWGTTGLDFQKVWSCFSVKNEMKESRTRDAGQPLSENSDRHKNNSADDMVRSPKTECTTTEFSFANSRHFREPLWV